MAQKEVMDAIRERRCYVDVELSVIIMHPKTWIDIVREIRGNYENPGQLVEQYHNLFLFGIPVFRSQDIAEGEFKVA